MRLATQIFWITFLCFIVNIGYGQYFQFSQYNFTKQRVNPALLSNSNYSSASLIFRHQPTVAGFSLNSNFLDVSYPILNKKGKRWSGIGLSFMDDRTGQQALFQTQEAALSYAIQATLSKRQTLSLGAKVLYQSKRLNLNGLFTGAQYIPDRGFQESVFNDEGNMTLRADYLSFNLGLYWQQTDKKGNTTSYLGFSFFDFNRPDNSFLEINSSLNTTAVGMLGFKAFKIEKLSLFPEVLVTINSNTILFNTGVMTRYALTSKSKGFNDYINILTKLVPGRSFITGLQLQKENFALGFSYDFPTGSGSLANTGAIEIGLEVRRLVLSKNKRNQLRKKTKTIETVKTSTLKKVKPQTQKKDSSNIKVISNTTLTSTEKKDIVSLSEKLRNKQDSLASLVKAGVIKHEPYVIEKTILHFNFEFNSANLDVESQQYLKDLSMALLDNPQLKIKLVGHTDNIGSDKFNLKLSIYRAEVIKDFITKQGIENNRILVDGKGMREPLNANKNDQERASNRRVELTIIYQD
jgi:type IX secretion system PorP/SprF family membrane protein